MENIYEEILFIKDKPLFRNSISIDSHKIFYKYTSRKYFKYIFNLLDALCEKSPYENKSSIFHLSLCFILKILYQSNNTPFLSNLDLITLNCFSLGVKSLTKQKLFPSITRLKKIYEQKFLQYNNKEILQGEIICLKLLNYDINLLTSYEYLEFILKQNYDITIKKHARENLENLIKNDLEKFLYSTPFDIAKECIISAKNNIVVKEPKIIQKKIISTKTFIGKNFLKKFSSSEKLFNSRDESCNNKYKNKEIINNIKKRNYMNNSNNDLKKQHNAFLSSIRINLKCSPDKIYYKKNCNNIFQNSSTSLIRDDNSSQNKTRIFKKKINKDSVLKNKYSFKSNILEERDIKKNTEICQKKLYLNNYKKLNKSFYDKIVHNMNNTQYFRRTNNYQKSKENDRNSQNLLSSETDNSGSIPYNKYSIESENVNNFKKDTNTRKIKYEIETKNIKLNYLNKKYLYGSEYKRNNIYSRVNKLHEKLNSSDNCFSNSSNSKTESLYGTQNIGNYFIK